MNARQADEGRSFLSKKGGGTKLGEKLVDERVNDLHRSVSMHDATHIALDGDGMARKKMDLYPQWCGIQPILRPVLGITEKCGGRSFPGNRIMEGGNASLEDMIKDTKKGILVTRFWYIRAVDPADIVVYRSYPRWNFLYRKRQAEASHQELPL